MAEQSYNSKFNGLEVDGRLDSVIPATPATSGEPGKGGLVPAPPLVVRMEVRLFLVT